MYPQQLTQEEQFQQQMLRQQEIPNLFESPEAIARHILETEPNNTGVINKDSARANLNPSELRTVRALGGLINEIEYAEKITGFDLQELKEYYKNEMSTTNVPSRSKDGFAIVLSKTDRRVDSQEINSFAGEVSDHFNNETEQGLLSKLPVVGGFFQKK